MNKTQKIAWFLLTGMLLMFFSLGYVFFHLFILKRTPQGFVAAYWPLLAFAVLITFSLYLIQRKQSPKEVEADERDNLIRKNAATAGLVSVCALLIAESGIAQLAVGQVGAIPVWMLTVINFSIIAVTMLVFSLVILVQYHWRSNGGK